MAPFGSCLVCFSTSLERVSAEDVLEKKNIISHRVENIFIDFKACMITPSKKYMLTFAIQ